jgi:hypothetical protein
MLKQNAMHCLVGIELVNRGKHIVCRCARRQLDHNRVHADSPARAALHADVGRRRRIIPDEDRSQYGRLVAISCLEGGNAFGEFPLMRRRYGFTVEKYAHALSPCMTNLEPARFKY